MMMEKKRHIWVSMVLSLLTPGMGQLYNGQIYKALLLYTLNIVGVLSMRVLFSSFSGFALFILLALCLYLFALSDAAYYSRKIRYLSVTRYNRWYVYLLIILINLLTNIWLRPTVTVSRL